MALRTEGASLFSLSRNVGAAIGVSVTSSVLAHNSQALHEIIGGAVTPFNRALQAVPLLDPATPQGVAMLDGIVNQQAQIIAYSNDYVLMIGATLPALLLLVFMRHKRQRRGADQISRSTSPIDLAGFQPGAASGRVARAIAPRRPIQEGERHETLYGPGTCALGIHVLLEEIGKPYEAQSVNLREGEHMKPPFTDVNPKSKVPTLVRDDGSVLTEFPAIAYWLARTNPGQKLLPDGFDDQARVMEAMDYVVATVHMQGFSRLFRASNFSANPADEEAVKARGKEIVEKAFALLDKQLAGKQFVAGDVLGGRPRAVLRRVLGRPARHHPAAEPRRAFRAHEVPPRGAERAQGGRARLRRDGRHSPARTPHSPVSASGSSGTARRTGTPGISPRGMSTFP